MISIKRKVVITSIFMLLAALSFFSGQAMAATTYIRVLLASGQTACAFNIANGTYDIIDEGSDDTICSVAKGSLVEVTSSGSDFIISVNGSEVGEATDSVYAKPTGSSAIFSYKNVKYRAAFYVCKSSAGIYILNKLDIEQYLYGVVGEEIGYNAPLEATKAQTVAARSFAYAYINPGAKYDVSNTTSSQSYMGYTAETSSGGDTIVEAVDATKGIVIYYTNPSTGARTVVPGYYHSNGGGHTEDIANVWGGGSIPLKGVASPEDSYALNNSWTASRYQWQVTYTPEQIVNLVKQYSGKDIGELEELNIVSKSDAGRVTEIEAVGSDGTASATKDSIRSFLGGLKSTLFDIVSGAGIWVKDGIGNKVQTSDANALRAYDYGGDIQEINGGKSTYYAVGSSGTVAQLSTENTGGNIIINGKGTGHGVGMSQWGAIGLAADGYTYEEILEHYYITSSAFSLDSID